MSANPLELFRAIADSDGGHNMKSAIHHATEKQLVGWHHEAEAHVLTAKDHEESMLARGIVRAIGAEAVRRMELELRA
jgi:hypothetical protein